MIEKELQWLEKFIQWRIKSHFDSGEVLQPGKKKTPPPLPQPTPETPYADLIAKHNFQPEEQLLLLLALCPHVQPNFLDDTIRKNLPDMGEFPQMGGRRGKDFRGFIPTGETACFLIGGSNAKKRAQARKFFHEEHTFAMHRILWIEEVAHGEPRMSGRVIINPDIVEQLLEGIIPRPRFSMDFPAEYITTELEDADLVLDKNTRLQLIELQNWVKHRDALMEEWNLKRWVKPGYRALFHGPPGTGKTLAAMILGKNTQRDIFRIDLSMVVSKYIGETEKNLSQLFDRARSKDWILFFDEADALFGKRTSVRDAHDKYANQEVAYLLQKIESHDGLVILASNFKTNIDEAFIRRFQAVIYFPPPTPMERLSLWKKTLPQKKGFRIPSDEELQAIARKYDITGAGIVNVVQYCALDSASAGSKEISARQIISGISREYQKEGKVF
ncbi:MAG: ATP-binding protein [Bacteroidetes bacterium]|nr:MAG: ATP-binding protein [Bacteroidota bacterium]